ncbi:MAG: hypothetical protein GX785_07920 [Armatimonadetes bacterium]|nr:hypothetical protein [Armatimonadota bacterium]
MRSRILTGLWLLALCAGVAGPAIGEERAPDWIAREKIRAGWIYYGDGADKLRFFKEHGLNALITSTANAETFDTWAKEAKRAGMRLFGVLGFSFDAEKAGMRCAVFGNGYKSTVACPLNEEFWQQRMIEPAVRLARQGMDGEREISGILIDFELYQNTNKGGQIYYTDACYCDYCFGEFLKSKALPDPGAVPFAQRVAWLKEKGVYEEYHPFLQTRVRALAEKMRDAVRAVHKEFFLGFYPIPHNWMLVGVAQGLGTPDHPMILWATATYGGGGAEKIPDNWREEMEKQGIHAYYCGGMLLRMYSAANLAAHMTRVAAKTNGYWLFTVHTLCIPPEQQRGDYYLAAGTREDYLREIRRANAEIDRLCADPASWKPIAFVPEPVRYRHTGYDVERFVIPQLEDRSAAARGKEMPVDPLPLIGSNYLMASLREGEEAAIRFQTDKAKSGDIWGVSYAILDPEKRVLREGTLPPGEETTLRFRAGVSGLHTVVLTAGYYGRCTVVSTTVPLALWTASQFEISRPGGSVRFYVPEGVEEFSISARCHFSTNAVKLTVVDPDGAVVKDTETDPFVRSVTFSVPSGGKTGRQWTLKVSDVPNKSYRSAFITFDKKLPPAVTLSADHLFVPAPAQGK